MTDEDAYIERLQPDYQRPESEPPVRSSDLLARAIAWVEYSNHKPWCNEAVGNIYASDGDPCDCGRSELLKDLNAARSNKKLTAAGWRERPN